VGRAEGGFATACYRRLAQRDHAMTGHAMEQPQENHR
jgi:hypothetical protein